MTEGALAQKKCTPCRGGVPPLNPDEVQSSLPQVAGWSAVDGDTKIAGEFRFKNFRQTLDFVTAIGELAESEYHHPVSISFGWGFCTIPCLGGDLSQKPRQYAVFRARDNLG